MEWHFLLLVALAAFFAGAFPFDDIMASALKSAGGIFGPRSISFVMVCANILKGWFVVYAACLLHPDAAYVAALMVFLGHVFPPQEGFRGGNGMGTLLGVMTGLHPVLGLVALISWLFTYYVYRYACLAAVVATAMTPLISAILDFGVPLPLLITFVIIVFWRHRICAARLTDGTEKMVDWDHAA